MIPQRLLFVAMSGVRVHDPELLALGLTLPGFVERSKVIASLPSLGLLTLAARTPPDWEIAYREYDELPTDAAETIHREGFQVVALSSLTARVLEAYRFAEKLRSLGIIVILGGLHASALPEEAARHADIVVQGEGELVWPRVLDGLRAGNFQRIYSSFGTSGGSHFSDHQPVPRYDLLDPSRYNRLTLQTICGLMPLTLIFLTLLNLNLHHVVFNIMGGIREADQTSQDAAYSLLFLLSVLSFPVSVLSALAWIGLVIRNLRSRFSKPKPEGGKTDLS